MPLIGTSSGLTEVCIDELDELIDVLIIAPTAGQSLIYDSINNQWINGSPSVGVANSVSNSDGTLTISPTTGAVVASLALGHANTWTGLITANGGFSMVAPATAQFIVYGGAFSGTIDNIYIGSSAPSTGAFTTLSATTATISSTLKILEGGSTPTKYTIFQGGDQTIDLTYTLPTAYPGGNGYSLTSTTAGVLSWTNVSGGGGGGSPGGASGNLQFNDGAGGFGGLTGSVAQSGASPHLLIQAQNAAYKILVLKGAASQSATLQEWQKSDGTVYGSVSGAGVPDFPGAGVSSQRVGAGSSASGDTSTAFGVNATADGGGGTVFGYGSLADNTGTYCTAIGRSASAVGGQGAVALGFVAAASGGGATAIGQLSVASTTATAIGSAANASGAGAIAIGTGSVASADYAVAISQGAQAASQSVAIGLAANATTSFSVAVGASSVATGAVSTAVGYSASATGTNAIAYGEASSAAGDYSVAVGRSASAGFSTSVAIGMISTTTAAKQFVCGGGSTFDVTNVFFGSGVVDTTPVAYTINGTGGSGTNIAGANINIAGGKGTGNAAGGDLNFQTSDAGSTGTTLQSLTTKMILSVTGLISKYKAIATAGWGIPAIYAAGRATAQTAANASVSTYTVGAADGSFEVSANVLVTTSTLHNFTVTCAYTDEGNTARTVTMPFSVLAGTFVTAITNASGAVPYEGLPIHIRCKASTAITVATTGTFTTVTYNAEGIIKQTA